ncbi:D-tyrosyl-tRNA deacylase [Trypanosoma conorhini]|uniref:D-aminoacyl-tRNA deacylase n=1 Tax=Trypanosoma conorhini TaxID=83891 RepID=A0A3R7KNB7_9TRYP|nr:D-tyrosyl-tRNA deacylase [Trypanosoma conorhini]RNE98020.1 D-tyrosyl-tRNA deacylase [Trypanosoma conorhini]
MFDIVATARLRHGGAMGLVGRFAVRVSLVLKNGRMKNVCLRENEFSRGVLRRPCAAVGECAQGVCVCVCACGASSHGVLQLKMRAAFFFFFLGGGLLAAFRSSCKRLRERRRTRRMRAVVQRVLSGSVTVGDEVVGAVGRGVAVLVGVHRDDTVDDVNYIARKLLALRIWPSEDGAKTWDRCVRQVGGGILLISQFTLMHVLKGNKPDFHLAMGPEGASEMFQRLRDALAREYAEDRIATGRFQAYMRVNLVNDGPVTIVLDSRNGQ